MSLARPKRAESDMVSACSRRHFFDTLLFGQALVPEQSQPAEVGLRHDQRDVV